MIKKTLYFGNPAYLSLKNSQLVIKLPEVENNSSLNDSFKEKSITTIPVEDIGVIILDNKQITLTHGLIEALLRNNCALITCCSKGLPNGLMLPLVGNSLQTERFKHQLNASLPLRKQLWQQTVQAKIENQAYLLRKYRGVVTKNLLSWSNTIRSGDPDNLEARAAVYYWSNMFPDIPEFKRDRDGVPPNNLLNYGYAILRAVVARSLVGSGMLPTIGLFHRNKYNAYCLADDIMEPYRPFVDKLILELMGVYKDYTAITIELKRELLKIPVLDVRMEGQLRPLMIAVRETTASLYQCFAGELRKIKYPTLK